jgi:hypothetical protein
MRIEFRSSKTFLGMSENLRTSSRVIKAAASSVFKLQIAVMKENWVSEGEPIMEFIRALMIWIFLNASMISSLNPRRCGLIAHRIESSKYPRASRGSAESALPRLEKIHFVKGCRLLNFYRRVRYC